MTLAPRILSASRGLAQSALHALPKLPAVANDLTEPSCRSRTRSTSPATCPTTQRRRAIPGLQQPVTIHRDEWSIPHIRAQNRNDAFAGLGFAHAQDRLFQMEALLRRGTGPLRGMARHAARCRATSWRGS